MRAWLALVLCALGACSLDLGEIRLAEDDAGVPDGGSGDAGHGDGDASAGDGDTSTGTGDGDGDAAADMDGGAGDAAAGDGDAAPLASTLQVVSTMPPEGGKDVSPTAEIRIVFDRELDPATVNTGSIKLRDGASLDNVPVELRVEGNTVIITPQRRLHLLAHHDVLIVGGVAGRDGVTVGESQTMALFTVREGVWSTASRIIDVSAEVKSVDVATFENGDAVALYVAGDGSPDDLFALDFDADDGWSTTPAPVESGSGTVTQAVLAGGGPGLAIAAWDQVDTRQRVYHALRTPAGWQAEAQAETEMPLLRSEEPQVAMNASGQAVVAWEMWTDGSTSNVWASYYDPTGGFTAPLAVDDGSTSYETHVAMGAEGVGFVVFNQDAASNTAVRRYVPGAGWDSTPALIGSVADTSADPRIGAGPNGTAFAAFALDVTTGFRAHASRFDPTMGWSTPEQVSSTTGNGDFPVSLAVGEYGDALLAWPQLDGHVHANFYNRFEAAWGSDSADVEPLAANGSALARTVVDRLGNGIVAWQSNAGNIVAARYRHGVGADAPVVIDTQLEEATPGGMEYFGADGRVLLTWVQAGDAWFSILQ